MNKLKTIVVPDWFIGTILFLLAAAIRAIPEIKADAWPIGYDTFNTYVAELTTYHGPLINWLKTANLFYFIFWPFKVLGASPTLLVKVFGPIFFGGLVTTFYYWSRNFVKFSQIKGLLASLLIIFQLATLRLSWDLYRNEIGLIFFFLALINLSKISKLKNLIYFLILSILVVLSNELVTAILLIVLLVWCLHLILKKKYSETLKLIIVFAAISLLFYWVIHSSGQSLYDPKVIFTSEKNYFWRYLYQYEKDMTYQQLFQTIGQLFWLFYQFLLPFSLYGFWLLRKNLILTTITLWLLVGTFSSLIFAGTGLIVWERWLIMLAFPLTIYAVEGIFNLGILVARARTWGEPRKILGYFLATIFILAYLGLFLWRSIPFLTTSYPDAKPPLADEELNNYFPRTMIHNSVGIWKIENTLACVEWLNKNVPSGAVVLVDNRYRGLMLTNFELDNRYIITTAWSEYWPQKSFDLAREKGFRQIYVIWNYQKWIKGYDRLYTSNNMAVYKAITPKPTAQ